MARQASWARAWAASDPDGCAPAVGATSPKCLHTVHQNSAVPGWAAGAAPGSGLPVIGPG